VVEPRIKSKRADIGGAGFDFPPLDLERMTELQMRVRDITIEFERFPIGVLGLGEASGFL
jgi:hypothetical protein